MNINIDKWLSPEQISKYLQTNIDKWLAPEQIAEYLDINTDKWLTLKQIADYLQRSRISIYKMAETGRIPAYKVGRQWRFRKEEIDKWIKKNGNSKKK